MAKRINVNIVGIFIGMTPELSELLSKSAHGTLIPSKNPLLLNGLMVKITQQLSLIEIYEFFKRKQ